MSVRTEHTRKINEILTKEFLNQKFCVERVSVGVIAQETGFPEHTVRNRLFLLGIRRGRRKRRCLLGEKFGKLRVIEKAPEVKCKNLVWVCLCDCGNTTSVLGGNLLSGVSKSCGCARHRKGKESPHWKGHEGLSGRYWCIIQSNAAKRGIPFNLEIEYAWDLYQQQQGKCALTGWPIGFESPMAQTASLDRIESDKAYEPGNVQWVHKDINWAKGDFPNDYFIQICQDVASQYPQKLG